MKGGQPELRRIQHTSDKHECEQILQPTSTPAMAMVFGVGYLRTRDTVVGVLITLGTLFFLALCAYFWWPLIGCGPMDVL